MSASLPILQILKATGEAVLWMTIGGWIVVAIVAFNAFTFGIALILLTLATFVRTRSH